MISEKINIIYFGFFLIAIILFNKIDFILFIILIITIVTNFLILCHIFSNKTIIIYFYVSYVVYWLLQSIVSNETIIFFLILIFFTKTKNFKSEIMRLFGIIIFSIAIFSQKINNIEEKLIIINYFLLFYSILLPWINNIIIFELHKDKISVFTIMNKIYLHICLKIFFICRIYFEINFICRWFLNVLILIIIPWSFFYFSWPIFGLFLINIFLIILSSAKEFYEQLIKSFILIRKVIINGGDSVKQKKMLNSIKRMIKIEGGEKRKVEMYIILLITEIEMKKVNNKKWAEQLIKELVQFNEITDKKFNDNLLLIKKHGTAPDFINNFDEQYLNIKNEKIKTKFLSKFDKNNMLSIKMFNNNFNYWIIKINERFETKYLDLVLFTINPTLISLIITPTIIFYNNG